MQAKSHRLRFVDGGLVQQIGACALLAQQIRRRIIGKPDLHRVQQRESDKHQHPGHTGKEVAPS